MNEVDVIIVSCEMLVYLVHFSPRSSFTLLMLLGFSYIYAKNTPDIFKDMRERERNIIFCTNNTPTTPLFSSCVPHKRDIPKKHGETFSQNSSPRNFNVGQQAHRGGLNKISSQRWTSSLSPSGWMRFWYLFFFAASISILREGRKHHQLVHSLFFR